MSAFPASPRTAQKLVVPPGVDTAKLLMGDWWKEEDLPISWDRLLPGGPLCVEVGFGGGEFLLGLARLNPDSRFVGIECFGEGHRRLMKAVAEAGLTNAISMVGDAYVVMNLAFHDASLTSLMVNFSDPWPKARHARNRLLSEEFLRIVARKLAPCGKVYAATDDVSYAEQASQVFSAQSELESRHPGQPWLHQSPHPIQTRYERKWIAEGRPLHYFVFEKGQRHAL